MDDYDSYDNETADYDDEDAPCDLKSNHAIEVIIQTYIYSFICILGVVGNVLVLVTYAYYKKAKTMTDIFLVNVALADLLFVVALPLIIYNQQYDWSMGTWACKLLRGIYSINLFCSTMLLACISADRYVSIVQARRSFGSRSKPRIYSRLICSAIWLLAFLLSVPTFVFSERYQDANLSGSPVVECDFVFDANTTLRMKTLVPGTQVAIGFFLPLVIMGFCYSNIMVTLLKAQSFQRHKAMGVVLVVVVAFILCHLPYNATLLCHTTRLFRERDCEVEKIILMSVTVTRIVAYLHCCLNPILYAFIGVKFRYHFCKIFKDLWCQGKRSIHSSQQTTELHVAAHKSTNGTISNHENPPSFSM